jgi:hypothetical protein
VIPGSSIGKTEASVHHSGCKRGKKWIPFPLTFILFRPSTVQILPAYMGENNLVYWLHWLKWLLSGNAFLDPPRNRN